MKVLHYTVKGDPRTKKNSQMIAGSGPKCPVCHKFQKQWIKQGKASDQWAEIAGWQIRPRPRRPIDYPVNVCYRFYMQTYRKVDQINLMEAMDDILVANHVLADDNSDIVAGHDGTRVYHDKNNPRVEIYITRMPDETPEQLKFLKGD